MGWGLGSSSHTHTHTNPFIVLPKLPQSKEEKKAPIYLNHLSVKNEGSTPPFFFSILLPLYPFIVASTLIAPLLERTKARREGEVKRVGVEGGGSPDKRLNDSVHSGMRKRKEER